MLKRPNFLTEELHGKILALLAEAKITGGNVERIVDGFDVHIGLFYYGGYGVWIYRGCKLIAHLWGGTEGEYSWMDCRSVEFSNTIGVPVK